MVFDGSVVDIQRLERFMWDVEKPPLPDVMKGFLKQQNFLSGTSAWTTIFLENHDQPRSINRLLTDDLKWYNKTGRLLATLCGSLSGTLFIYQGQEIGMMNFPTNWDEEKLRDPADKNKLREIEKKYPGDRSWYDKVFGGIQRMGRDNARTPVQWSDEPNAGFTTGDTPWMDVHDNYKTINIKQQENDPNSVLNAWKTMLELRKKYEDAIVFGKFVVHDLEDEKVFLYTKEYHGKQTLLGILNWTATEQDYKLPEGMDGKSLKLLVSNTEGKEAISGTLEPYEARLYLVE